MSEARELWSTERIRVELGAKTIRSAGRIIVRLGLTPVSREPGRSGMNLYDAAVARPIIAEHLARRRRKAEQNQSVPDLYPNGSPGE